MKSQGGVRKGCSTGNSVGVGGSGSSQIGVQLGIGRDSVGPGQGHSLAFVLHSTVLEPYLL